MIILWLIVFFSSLNLLSSTHWILELNANCGEAYFFLHLFLVIVLIARRFLIRNSVTSDKAPRLLIIASLLGVIFYGVAMLKFYLPHKPLSTKMPITVTALFLPDQTNQCDILTRFARSYPSELVAVFNLKDPCADTVDQLPYSVIREQPDPYGFGVWSAFPLSLGLQNVGDLLPPLLQVRVQQTAEKSFALNLFRALPGLSSDAAESNKLLFRRIATVLRHSDEPHIVIAQMFQTPYSRSYRKFVEGGELTDVAEGFGWHHTWQWKLPLIGSPLNHTFSKGEIGISSFEVLPSAGSLHLPLRTQFHVEESRTKFTPAAGAS